MSYYGHDKFVHPVPTGYTIPAGTPVYCEESAPHPVETFFTLMSDYQVEASSEVKFYLTSDITKPKPPIKINSVIYNVRVGKDVFPVAVHRGSHMWSAFFKHGGRKTIYSPEIESFDTTPPSDDRYAANEAKQREAAES